MQVRMAVALGLSTAAHAGFVWMLGDRLPSNAAPAQRAMTVSMAPAAPRAVLNSIAPSMTASVTPSEVRAVAAMRVPVVDEPDAHLVARAAESVEALAPRPMATVEPDKTLHDDERPTRLVAAVSSSAEFLLAKTVERDTAARPSRAERASEPQQRAPRSTAPRAPAAAAAVAEPAVEARPAIADIARAASTPPGEPGADRVARPASGNEPPKYPWRARVRGDEGRVVVSVWISAEGEAERLAVLQSSGHAALDRAAIEAVGHWHFEPARRAGAETASMLYVPVIFRLE